MVASIQRYIGLRNFSSNSRLGHSGWIYQLVRSTCYFMQIHLFLSALLYMVMKKLPLLSFYLSISPPTPPSPLSPPLSLPLPPSLPLHFHILPSPLLYPIPSSPICIYLQPPLIHRAFIHLHSAKPAACLYFSLPPTPQLTSQISGNFPFPFSERSLTFRITPSTGLGSNPCPLVRSTRKSVNFKSLF